MAPLNWATYLERAVGKGHPTLSQTIDRALRQMLSESGYNPDATTFPGLMGPVFNLKAFGALGDNAADDTTAILTWIGTAQASVAAGAGGVLIAPAGIYRYSSEVVIANSNVAIQGAGIGISASATIFRSTTATARFRISGQGCALSGFELDGNNIATHGLVLHNANSCFSQRLLVGRCVSHGIRLDTAFASPGGNNNLAKFVACITNSNGGAGVAVPLGDQVNNNGIEFSGHMSNNNASHGLLYKGDDLRVFGGLFETNGGYGIQISESGDTQTSNDGLILHPWIEANSLGGAFGGGKSTRNFYVLGAISQHLANNAGSEDIELYVGNNLSRAIELGGFGVIGPIISAMGYMQFSEIASPGAPAGNMGRMYCEDNGSGKTRLVVRFPTGAVQVIATEP